MQEFLTNNKVSCNLMSLTGYRTLVIFAALLSGPKSSNEINDCLFNNQYIKERFSGDTLRIYINSLRSIGCEITRADRANSKRYSLISHPFAYNIPKLQLKAISSLYKNIYEELDLKEIIIIEDFFKKISEKLINDYTKNFLQNISVLKNVDRSILNDLLLHCKNKNQIVFLYNSPKTGEKMIEIIADKLSFKSNKLYLWGNNFTHNEYSYFLVERILEICNIKFFKTKERFPFIKIIYEIYDLNYKLETDEKIIEKTKNKMIIETNAQNEFNVMQRILYLSNNCKVLKPESFKIKLMNKLKTMEKNYENV